MHKLIGGMFETTPDEISSLIDALNQIKSLEMRVSILEKVLKYTEEDSCYYLYWDTDEDIQNFQFAKVVLESSLISNRRELDSSRVKMASSAIYFSGQYQQSRFFELPNEMLIKIASHVAEIIDEKEANDVAANSFNEASSWLLRSG